MRTVLYERKDGVSYIYLNRPDRYNALNVEALQQLLLVVEEVGQNEDQVVILAGKGKAFCAGGDIGMMNDWADEANFGGVMDTISNVMMKLYEMPKIIISAIQGSAAGLGLSLALAADYVIAENKAKLGMLFLGVGLAPDGGGHFWLKERLGVPQAKQFIWNMEQVTGEEAKQMGLIDFSTEQQAVAFAEHLAKKMKQSPITSMIQTKSMYHREGKEQLQYYLNEEKKTQWLLCHTADHREGVQAFLEKRSPVFIGK
ncbi:enoyl-CoA hydratase-related protein [Virgibacillus soli]|uniref:Enoyl-CoA hydratase-related protein n=1 Tax=Paracerasibacillus soli TaxID=480284 RepID=A0ABU5CPQ6_9BACI|nr:enoyl-CoA hydratase-related protein [Virgibacillus soli]MDY0407804.1 enoyl-CoA hydratase-related protein [Virgibacillus soli]